MKWKALHIVCIIYTFICSEVGVVFAQGITGSVHDFSPQSYTIEICNVCHTPHNADSTVTPLWDHELSAATYILYTSPTIDAPIHQPGRASKLCLSCHDGTVAIDSFGGATGSSYVTGDALIGTDLSDDHPVGVEWDHQTLGSCGTCHSDNGYGPPITMILPFYKEGGKAKIECATCHDPHDNVPDTNGKLLRKPLAGSEICLYCHLDK